MLALAGIAAIFCRSLSACRRPLHCRLVESEKPTASPQRSPETQIDHRPDGLRRRPPCCFSVASWPLCSFLLLPFLQYSAPWRALHRQRNTPRGWCRTGLRLRRRPVSRTAKMTYKQTAESKPRSNSAPQPVWPAASILAPFPSLPRHSSGRGFPIRGSVLCCYVCHAPNGPATVVGDQHRSAPHYFVGTGADGARVVENIAVVAHFHVALLTSLAR